MAAPDPQAVERAMYCSMLGITDNPSYTLAELRNMTGGGTNVAKATKATLADIGRYSNVDNKVLPKGTPGIDVDSGAFKIGDGVTPWSTLPVAAGGSGVTAHAMLTGLLNDDHTQYHTDARGDARYYTKTAMDTALGLKADSSTVALKADTSTVNASLALKQDLNYTLNARTASYTLVLTDNGKLITMTAAGATTISIPTDASVNFPVGARVDVAVMGAGMVTINAVTPGTTTVVGTPTTVSRAQYSVLSLIKLAANSWLVTGDLA